MEAGVRPAGRARRPSSINAARRRRYKLLEFLVLPLFILKVLSCLTPPCRLPSPTPLTSFTEDEIMFRDNIRQFADEKVRPLVKEMDEKGVFDQDLIHQFFQLGLDGYRDSRTVRRRWRQVL